MPLKMKLAASLAALSSGLVNAASTACPSVVTISINTATDCPVPTVTPFSNGNTPSSTSPGVVSSVNTDHGQYRFAGFYPLIPDQPILQKRAGVDRRALLSGQSTTSGSMTVEYCASLCFNDYFALSIGNECTCGQTGPKGIPIFDPATTNPCSGNAAEACGSPGYAVVYVRISITPNSNPALTSSESAAAASASAAASTSAVSSASAAASASAASSASISATEATTMTSMMTSFTGAPTSSEAASSMSEMSGVTGASSSAEASITSAASISSESSAASSDSVISMESSSTAEASMSSAAIESSSSSSIMSLESASSGIPSSSASVASSSEAMMTSSTSASTSTTAMASSTSSGFNVAILPSGSTSSGLPVSTQVSSSSLSSSSNQAPLSSSSKVPSSSSSVTSTTAQALSSSSTSSSKASSTTAISSTISTSASSSTVQSTTSVPSSTPVILTSTTSSSKSSSTAILSTTSPAVSSTPSSTPPSSTLRSSTIASSTAPSSTPVSSTAKPSSTPGVVSSARVFPSSTVSYYTNTATYTSLVASPQCTKANQGEYDDILGGTYNINCGQSVDATVNLAIHADDLEACTFYCDFTAGCAGITYTDPTSNVQRNCNPFIKFRGYTSPPLQSGNANSVAVPADGPGPATDYQSNLCTDPTYGDGSTYNDFQGNSYTLGCGYQLVGGTQLTCMAVDSLQACTDYCQLYNGCVEVNYQGQGYPTTAGTCNCFPASSHGTKTANSGYSNAIYNPPPQ